MLLNSSDKNVDNKESKRSIQIYHTEHIFSFENFNQ